MIIDNPTPISKTSTDPAIIKLLEDLQGNILKSHSKPNVELLFLKFVGSPDEVKQWITTLPVTSMKRQLADHESIKLERVPASNLLFCSFSLSKPGYEYLQLNSDFLTDTSFQSGMGVNSILQDPPKTAWEQAYQNRIDALVILAHDDPATLKVDAQRILATATGRAVAVAHETGKALLGEKEHFGFADGISQPRFFIEDKKKETDQSWDPSASLNLALVRDQLGSAFTGGFTGRGDFPVDDFSGDHSYGSYLVMRKLEQDVDGWNQAVADLAGNLGLGPDLVGAFAVGRFQDGTPVVNHSVAQGTIPIENDFNYAQDRNGAKCPFHAHIRKANPRGDTTHEFDVPLESEKRKRITRRGIPYETKGRKGLLFMCYQSSITGQFDFMQNSWIDNENFVRKDTGTDDAIGQGASTPKSWPSSHGGSPFPNKFSFGNFVTMQGGGYFFTPSVSFLKGLNTLQFAKKNARLHLRAEHALFTGDNAFRDPDIVNKIKEAILIAANINIDPAVLDDEVTFDQLRFNSAMFTQLAGLLTDILAELGSDETVSRDEIEETKTVGGCIELVFEKLGKS